MADERGSVRLATAGLAVLIGGGLGAFGLTSPAGAAAQTVRPAMVTTVVTKAAAACATGKYQKAVEGYLKKLGGFGTVKVDGKRSAADCAAIKKFQSRYGIKPAAGLAGPTTNGVAKRLAATKTSACKPKKTGIVFCVDLTHQTIWSVKNGKVLTKPTVTRTGMNGYRTPAGSYKINKRAKKEWSNPYKVWLPYWQHFTQGMGFHETTTYLHNMGNGSHGCVNLLKPDAKELWNLLGYSTTVHTFGRRPGT